MVGRPAVAEHRGPARILSQGEVEEQILAVSDAIEAEVHRYSGLADAAASAEADYKLRYAETVVRIADSQARMSIPERAARAELEAATELRRFKIMEARRQASKESLLSLRARLDALRSLSANIRAAT